MNFSEILKNAVERVDGAVSALIIGSDGISVQEYTSEKLLDTTGLSAEASAVIKDMNVVTDNLGIGEAREFSLISEKCSIILRRINPDYYLTLVIKPEGNFGKGRFILRTSIPKVEKEF